MSQSLIEAAKAGNSMAVKSLIVTGENVNQSDDKGWTALNWAAGKGDIDTVKVLVEAGADLSSVGNDQRTPYLIALAAGKVAVARYLREAEAQISGREVKSDRKYCKAHQLSELRRFADWSESMMNWKNGARANSSEEPELNGEDIVFIHQDLTVTRSMWHNEDIIYSQVTPEWEEFCNDVLAFRVPDDLELTGAAQTIQ